MAVEFFSMKASIAKVRPELEVAASAVFDSAYVILGPKLEAFEEAFAAFCGVRYCIGVGNGLDALTLALRSRGVGLGDEVIVPAHTFIATWLAVAQAGATPKPVEVDPRTFNLDVSAIRAALTPRTAAIIPVHLYGQPAAMMEIKALADQHGLFVLEDAAQAHGARLGGRVAGSLGHAAAFSFYPTKNLGAIGDGGAIVTDDSVVAETARKLRNYGSTMKYVHEIAGTNSRLDEIQAAMLSVKLPNLSGENAQRRQIADWYRDALSATPEVMTPFVADGVEHVYHLYVVRTPRRDHVATKLREAGIGTLVHYPIPPHRQAAFASRADYGHFPVTDQLAEEILSLPMWPGMTRAHVEEVADEIRRALA